MICREKNGFVMADKRCEYDSVAALGGATYNFEPSVRELPEFTLDQALQKVLGKSSSGFVIRNCKTGDVVSSAPGVAATFDLYVGKEYSLLQYTPGETRCRIYRVKGAKIDNFEKFLPTQVFSDEMAILTGVLPDTYVVANGYYYSFYDIKSEANLAGLLSAKRLAFKNRRLVFADGLNVQSYPPLTVPQTVYAVRARFYNNSVMAPNADVVIKPSTQARDAARSALSRMAMGQQTTAKDVDELRKYILDYSNDEVVNQGDAAVPSFLPALLDKVKPSDPTLLLGIVFSFSNTAAVTAFVNNDDDSKCIGYDTNNVKLDVAYAELIKDLEAAARALELSLNTLFASWYQSANAYQVALNDALHSIASFKLSREKVLSFTSKVNGQKRPNFAQLLPEACELKLTGSLTGSIAQTMPLSKVSVEPGSKVQVSGDGAVANAISNAVNSSHLIPLCLDSDEGTSEQGASLIAERVSDDEITKLTELAKDKVVDEITNKIAGDVSDYLERLYAMLDTNYSQDVGVTLRDEDGDYRKMSVVLSWKKKIKWFLKSYNSVCETSAILWPHPETASGQLQGESINFGRSTVKLSQSHCEARVKGREAILTAYNNTFGTDHLITALRMLPFEPKSVATGSDKIELDSPISGLKIELSRVTAYKNGKPSEQISVDISSDIYVNMAPFVHAAFGQEGARSMNKAFVYDVAQSQELGCYYVCQTAYTHPAVKELKCTSFHGHDGCVDEKASGSYTAAKVITGILTGGLGLLGFGSGDPQGPNIGSHNKWPKGVYSESGQEIPHCYMATCYDKFRLSKSYDIEIGTEKILSIISESQPVVIRKGGVTSCVLGGVSYSEVTENGVKKKQKRVTVDRKSYDVRGAFEKPCNSAVAKYDLATDEAYFKYVYEVASVIGNTIPTAYVRSAGHLVGTTMAAYLQRASSKDSKGTTVFTFASALEKLLVVLDKEEGTLTDQEARIRSALTRKDSAGTMVSTKLKALKNQFDQALANIDALSPFYLLTEEQIEVISNGVFCPGLIGYYAISQ